MSYNTRRSGRFNTPGRFVSAGEMHEQAPNMHSHPQQSQFNQQQEYNQNQQYNQQQYQEQEQYDEQQDYPMNETMTEEMNVDTGTDIKSEGRRKYPYWMKNKLGGVKKTPKRERRRRQNENLRRLLTPKNALMVLNEMMPAEQLASQLRVAPSEAPSSLYKSPNSQTYCADLTIDGVTYKGYGVNKMEARNAAAEQAIRDLILKRMSKPDAENKAGEDGGEEQEADGNEEQNPKTLPMIQLASFALHKLFSEWEGEGHKVPLLKPNPNQNAEGEKEKNGAASTGGGAAVSGGASSAKIRELPATASSMHPCMLLTYMRPGLEYRELAVEGDRPQTMLFTIGVDVDGATYIGKASNKKEARKQAARAACEQLYHVTFDALPPAPAPAPAAGAAPASARSLAPPPPPPMSAN